MAAAPLLSVCCITCPPPTYNRWIISSPPTPTCHYSLSSRRRWPGLRCSLGYIKAPSPPASPWLVLEPGETVYNLYSLEEDRVVSLSKTKLDGSDWDDQVLVGSSHGWLALFDTKSKHVFLSNPISGRHIKLPQCPDRWHPSRVILSCSPDVDEGCYAIQHHCCGPAICTVGGQEAAWTQLVPESYERDVFLFSYCDAAYCSSRRVLNFITRSSFEFDSGGVRVRDNRHAHADHQIDDWDVASMKRVDMTWFWRFEGPPHAWKEDEDGDFLTNHCRQTLHLVYLQHQPLIVVRFETKSSSTTAGFVVLEIEKEKQRIKVVEDLNGLALFVGMNHSFAVAVAGQGGGNLKPNSIYFTNMMTCCDSNISYVGSFDYHNKTFSTFLPSHSNSSLPLWFLPTHPC